MLPSRLIKREEGRRKESEVEVVIALYRHTEEHGGEQGMIVGQSAMVITGAGRGL